MTREIHWPAQAMRIKHDIRFKLMATGLRLAGHKKVGQLLR